MNTLPNGVIHHNMPLSTTNILIVSVSIPYRFRINPVSFPYRFRIVSVSFPYRSPIVLLSFSYWGSGNNTETIRNRTEDERMRNGGTGGVILLLSKSQRQWQDSNKLLWVSTCHLSTTTKSDRLMPNMSRIWNSLPNGVTHLSCPLSTSKFDKTMHKIS